MKNLFTSFLGIVMGLFIFSSTTFAADNGNDGIDKNCSDFSTPEDAQAYFTNDGGSAARNIDDLDEDQDGIPCENLSSTGGNDTNNGDSSTNNEDSNTNNGNQNTGTSENPGTSDTNNTTDQVGEKLPNTATSYPNSMLLGFILLLIGVLALNLKRSK
ncbi:excalibur calcium-binding domain-containing protein [Thermoflavimicrobium dichotomicum]|uniref:LPXTG-motif cell wall anchor domain-containing protein n=1 Tax=Thermoflavimicrobium dichotomicum TaxID=46223 RepID=A0A1I3UAJ1_9BACL|nr:excalibur calcium-binding domain-containing protein [Thermoflavimicrobium dichotomicum]SFJ80568.1 LPXTG-motif cell wall anchor domain-containing protein [Thermoflavimicrobium dichotomicum]